MAEEKTISQENFALLLNWLDTDLDRAAEKYENIRRRLIKVLAGRGCHEAEYLADLTIDRVTLKVPKISGNFTGEPAAYFYGVVHNVHLEWLRQQKSALENTAAFPVVVDSNEEREAEFRCLESCLTKLAANVRMMVIEYYRDEKKAKIERRKRLSGRLGISTGALQIRMSRVRNTILECVRQCLAETQ